MFLAIVKIDLYIYYTATGEDTFFAGLVHTLLHCRHETAAYVLASQ